MRSSNNAYVEPSLFVIDIGGDPGAGASYLRSPRAIPDEELMSRVLNIKVVVVDNAAASRHPLELPLSIRPGRSEMPP